MLGTLPMRTENRAGRVLVVDDEPAVRELVARHYRRAGYQVVAAASAEEVKTRGHVRREWDIVITDIHLPGLSGIELARMLSERSGSMVLMTGDHDHELEGVALKGLQAGYLLKPFELFELDALVRVSGKTESARRWWARFFPKTRNAVMRPSNVPMSALLVSIAALTAPIFAMLGAAGGRNIELLLWLCALIPAFLLSLHRGWRGLATALALGMALLAILQMASSIFLITLPATLIGLGIGLMASGLGAAWLSRQLHRAQTAAQRRALTDQLTNLPNRAALDDHLSTRFAAGRRRIGRAAIAFFDIDGFRQWNDQLGHDAGDEALRAVADVLREQTRHTEKVGRYGGEEFMTVLNANDFSAVMMYVERVRKALSKLELHDRRITVSVGIAFQEAWMKEPGELVTAADAALYAAKAAGRDCVRLAESIIGEPVAAQPAAEPGLRLVS